MFGAKKIKKVLFVGAHTDDEVICAGTLTKLKKEGVQIDIVTFSKSTTPQGGDILEEYYTSMELLGASYELFNYGDDSIPAHEHEIRQVLYSYVTHEQYDLAFILSPHDDHQAHACVGKEAQRVMKNRVPNIIRCQYPWNYTSMNPNLYVQLTDDEFQKKLEVMRNYRSQAFRYQYDKIFEHSCLADGLSIKQEGPVEKFEIVRLTI